MLSPYRYPPNSIKRKQKISNREHDLERPQLTSYDIKRPQMTSNENDGSVFRKLKQKVSEELAIQMITLIVEEIL